MVPHYYRSVNAVVFVYDMNKPETFHNLPFWIEECNHYNLTSEVPRILVGNKCDQAELTGAAPGESGEPSSSPRVPTHLAQRFADEHQMPLFETSAKDESKANHVEAIFLTLAHKLRQSKPMMSPSYGRSLANSSSPAINISVRERPSERFGSDSYGGSNRNFDGSNPDPNQAFSCC